MSDLGTTWERESLGNDRYRHTQHLRPIAYRDGILRHIDNDWQDGDEQRPHIVTRAPFLISVANDGMRRIHPTRELDRYLEMGAPFVKIGGVWQQVNLGQPTRQGNRLKWTTNNANMYVDMGGHFIKLGILLKGGWVPPGGQFAFPVDLTGLTRQGGQLLADGQPVMSIRAPHVEDYDNSDDVRPVAHDFVQVDGQWYVLFTLPNLAGMSRPLVDPTLELQPDATDGKDTFFNGNQANQNYGASTDVAVGQQSGQADLFRGLLSFDLTSLPSDAAISSSTLSLYATSDLSTNARTFRVYRQKRAWVEGTSQNPGTTGATWNNYETSTPTAWQVAGGFGVNDCEQIDIGSRDFTAAEALNEFKDFPLTPTSKAGLDLGNGWMIKADTENADAYVFASSDNATAANRPKLVVEYRLAPPAQGMSMPAQPVYMVSAAELKINGGRYCMGQGAAIPVYEATGVLESGPMQPVYVIDASDLEENGGRWKLMAQDPIPIIEVPVADRPLVGNICQPVYLVGS